MNTFIGSSCKTSNEMYISLAAQKNSSEMQHFLGNLMQPEAQRDTLRENRALTCVKIFAVRFLLGARLLCRAFYIGRTAKRKRTGKIVCRAFFWDARQTLFLTFVVPALTPRGNR
jgi:hypothetical protein